MSDDAQANIQDNSCWHPYHPSHRINCCHTDCNYSFDSHSVVDFGHKSRRFLAQIVVGHIVESHIVAAVGREDHLELILMEIIVLFLMDSVAAAAAAVGNHQGTVAH